MDGTILNTLRDIANAVNHALEVYGLPTHELYKFMSFIGDGTDMMLYRALPEELKTQSKVLEIKPEYVKFYDAHLLDTTKPYDDIPELLKALKEKGIKLAVVSNKIDCMVQIIAEDFFKGTFDYVTGQKEGYPVKPDPTSVFEAMKYLKVKPEECIFVGDSGVDAKTGVNAGVFTVGVSWGFRDADELLENGANVVINKPFELLEYIFD